MANTAINTSWAQNTSNSLSFTENEIGLGITYQGSVVSNQLNGVASWLSKIAQYQQRSGGLYISTKKYFKNDVVSIVHKNAGTPLTLEFYICIDETETGISNRPPITNASVDSSNEIEIYSGGEVDLLRWSRIDSGNKGSGKVTLSSPSGNIWYKVITIDTSGSGILENTEVESEGRVFIELSQGGWVAFKVKLTCVFYVKSDGTITFANNEYADPVPSISISDLRYSSIAPSSGTIADLMNDLLLYGLRFEVGYTQSTSSATKSYGIFAKCRSDVSSITIDFKGLPPCISISGSEVSANYTALMYIPVIEGIGPERITHLGELVEFDFTLSDRNAYDKGLLNVGVVQTLSAPKYGMFTRKFTRGSSITHDSAHTRCGGELVTTIPTEEGGEYSSLAVGDIQEPALPNISGIGGASDINTNIATFNWSPRTSDNGATYTHEEGFYSTDTGALVSKWRNRMKYSCLFGDQKIYVKTSYGSAQQNYTGYNPRVTRFEAYKSNPTYKEWWMDEFEDVKTRAVIVLRYIRIF